MATAPIMETLLAEILERAYLAGPLRLRRLAHGEKGVLHVRRAGAPDWVARIYPTDDHVPILNRALALAQLLVVLEEQEYPAERVVRSIDGALTVFVEGWHVLVTTYLGPPLQAWQPANGPSPPNSLPLAETNGDAQLYFSVGALLGRLHALGAAVPVIAPGLQVASELAWASACLAEIRDRVPPQRQDEYTRLVTRIQQIGPLDDCPQTIIHGDVHLGNVVVTSTGAYVFVDWEAAGRGAAVTDLGQLLSWCVAPSDRTPNVSLVRAVVDGYCGYRVVTQIERELLPDALRFRVLVTLAGAFEQRCSPDYQSDQRFWGYTYDQWERHEQHITQIARVAQDQLDARSSVGRAQ